MKIFVLDPEMEKRQQCYDFFQSKGWKVTTITKPDEIFNLLKTEKPDVILLGLGKFPEAPTKLLRSLPRAAGEKVPVVVLAHKITPEIEKDIMESGALEILPYSTPLPELFQKISRVATFVDPRQAKEEGADTGTPRLLIVDDDAQIRQLLKFYFESKGFETIMAQSGEEALEKLKSENPSMVLLDVTMPGMDGLLTLKKMKEINPQIGIVMATGLQDEAIAKKAADLGAYAYVMKPFDMKYLELVVTTRLFLSL